VIVATFVCRRASRYVQIRGREENRVDASRLQGSPCGSTPCRSTLTTLQKNSVARHPPFFYICPASFSRKGTSMARVCEVCGKRPVSGNNISHAHNRTRRRWLPNLQSVRAKVNGRVTRMQVCAQCLKSNRVLKAA